MKKILFFCIFLIEQTCFALYQIRKPFVSTRSVGMGGVKISTGLYEENFFNNPARVTENPTNRFTLLKLTPLETNAQSINMIQNLSKNQDIKTVTNAVGQNVHYQGQVILPAFYLTTNESRNWAFGVGLIANTQADAILRSSFNANLEAAASVGPALTYGYKFFNQQPLSLGVSAHFIAQGGAESNVSLVDFVESNSLRNLLSTNSNLVLDFDFGLTYLLLNFYDYQVNFALSIQNVFNGENTFALTKTNQSLNFSNPRSYGFGFNLVTPYLFNLSDTTFAIELTDISNNPDGSFFKLFHVGLETHISLFALRAGFNQGYVTAGLGIDLSYITFDFATYGEELELNVGTFEDRRYTLTVGIEL